MRLRPAYVFILKPFLTDTWNLNREKKNGWTMPDRKSCGSGGTLMKMRFGITFHAIRHPLLFYPLFWKGKR